MTDGSSDTDGVKRLITGVRDVNFLAVRDEYLGICGGDACAAALLDFFERFSLWKQREGYASWDWVYQSQDALVEHLRGIWSKTVIKRTLAKLRTDWGFVETRKHKPNSFDQTLEYRFATAAVQAAVNDWLTRTDALVPTNQSTGSHEPIDKSDITYRKGEANSSTGQMQPLDRLERTDALVRTDHSLYIESFLEFILSFVHSESSSSSPLDAAGALNADDDDDPQTIVPPENHFSRKDKAPEVETLFRDNIGALTPLIRLHLQDAARLHGEEAVRAAITRAAEYGGRSWRYVAECLENTRSPDETDGQKFIRGEYAAWVQH